MPEPTIPDPEAVIDALLPASGIALQPEWRPAVAANFATAAAIARSLMAFPLPEETEAAPVFEPGR